MRVGRIVLYGGIFFCSLIALVAIFLLTADLGRFKPRLESWLSELIGRELRVDGPLSITVDIERGISLRASRVFLASTEWAEEPALVSVAGLSARLPLAALLRQPVMLEEIHAQGLRLELEQLPDGRVNWNLGSAGAPEPEVLETGGEEPFRLPVWVRQLRLTDSRLVLRHPGLARPLTVRLAAVAGDTDRDYAVTLGGEGTINDEPLRLDLRSRNPHSLIELRDVQLELDGSLGEVRFAGDLAVPELLDPQRPTASLQVKGPSVDYLFDLLAMQAFTSGPLDLNLDLTQQGDMRQLKLAGHFGQFTLSASGLAENLLRLQQAELDFSAAGPDASRPLGLLGITHFPQRVFKLTGRVTRSNSDFRVQGLDLLLGPDRLQGSGEWIGFPDPDGATARLELQVPEMSEYAPFLGLPGELAGDLRLDAEVRHRPGGGAAVVAEGLADDVEFRLDGQLLDKPDFEGSQADLTLSAPGMRLLAGALGLPGEFDTPLAFSARLTRTAAGIGVERAEVSLGPDDLWLSGEIALDIWSEPTRLEFTLQASDPAVSLARYGIELPFPLAGEGRLTGSLRGTGDGLQIQPVELLIGKNEASLQVLLLDRDNFFGSGASLRLAGPNLTAILPVDPRLTGLDKPYTLEARLELGAETFRVVGASLTVGQTRLQGAGEVGLSPLLASGSLSLTGDSPDLLPLTSASQVPPGLRAMPASVRLETAWRDNHWQVDELALEVGEGHLEGRGTLEGPPDFGATDLRLTGELKSLANLNPLFDRQLPASPASFEFQLVQSEGMLRLRDFRLLAGASDLEGEGSLTYAGAVPRIEARAHSRTLDITPFLPPRQESAATERQDRARGVAGRLAGENRRIIPATPVDLSFLDRFSAELDLTADTVRIEAHELQDAVLRGEVREGILEIREFGMSAPNGGWLKGTAGAGARPGGGSHIGMRLWGEGLRVGLPADDEQELEGLPRYDVNLALVTEGATLREMAANLNAYLRMEAGPGRIRAGALRMFTGDFGSELLRTVNPFIEQEPYSKVKCMTLLAAAEQGRARGKPFFLMQSERLKITADARLDLATEELEVRFHTVPRKGLGISLSSLINPFVAVTGTLGNPLLTLDPQATVIQGGAAVATGGLSILARSLADRFLADKDPCGQALLDSDKRIKELEERYARPLEQRYLLSPEELDGQQ